MNNKRFNKFTKSLKNFSEHPMFSKLRKLYIMDDVKQLRTAENWLNKMTITKKGDITKKSNTLVNKINEMYNKYDIKVEAKMSYTYKTLVKSISSFLPKLQQVGDDINFMAFKIWFLRKLKEWNNKYHTSYYIIEIEYTLFDMDDIDDNFEGKQKLVKQTYYSDIPLNRVDYLEWMSKHTYDFCIDSSDFKVRETVKGYKYVDKITFKPIDQINAVKTKQKFLDSVNKHCFLDPIIIWATQKTESCNSVSAKSKYEKIIEKIEKTWRPSFINGMDEEKIEDLCKDLNLNIKIDLPFKNNTCRMIECIVNNKPLKTFKFINTRFNHVNETVLDNNKMIENIEVKSLEEMNKKYKLLVDNNEFCTYNKNSTGGLIKINTCNKIYVYNDDYSKTIRDFEHTNNINMFKLDYVNDYEVCKFIDNSIHFNTITQFNNNKGLNLEHLDQKKAYTQFKKCSEYNGFLGKITDFRKCNLYHALNNIGIYQINNIIFHYDKMKEINDKMKIFINQCVYPSSDLHFLIKYADFEVIGGCWGVRMEFDFNDDMINKKVDNVSYYAKYTGSISSVNKYKKYYMKGTKEYFENMLHHYDEDKKEMVSYNNFTKISYDDKTQEAEIKYNKDYIPYKCHIASFILSYQRIHMLNQLMEMDINKIVRIVTDGIYYDKHDFKINNTFRLKTVKNIEKLAYYSDSEGYLSNIKIEQYNFNEFVEHNILNAYIGAGGTGKSTTILNDCGYIKPLYVAPSWKLSRSMRKNYKCDATVLARCLNDTDELFYFLSNFNVIIFDEISQYTEDVKEVLLKKFKYHKIFFVGDIGYQLPPVQGVVMKINKEWNIKKFTKVHRFKCDELASLCSTLRKFIGDGMRKEYINSYVLKKYKHRIVNDIENYNEKEDMILCSKNKCNVHSKTTCNCDNKNFCQQWTDKFKHLDKYLVKHNTLEYSNGDICYSEINGAVLNHGFSVHSIQGETIEGKIFIDMRKLFSVQMLYTAISRARYLDQIYFLDNIVIKPIIKKEPKNIIKKVKIIKYETTETEYKNNLKFIEYYNNKINSPSVDKKSIEYINNIYNKVMLYNQKYKMERQHI